MCNFLCQQEPGKSEISKGFLKMTFKTSLIKIHKMFVHDKCTINMLNGDNEEYSEIIRLLY